MATPNAKELPDIAVPAKERVKRLTWTEFEADRTGALNNILDASGYSDDDKHKLQNILEVGVKSYARKRTEDVLWKTCEGKQVLNDVARSVGFAGMPALVQATFAAWAREGATIPQELLGLRAYVAAL
jgi:hypothetical protein